MTGISLFSHWLRSSSVIASISGLLFPRGGKWLLEGPYTAISEGRERFFLSSSHESPRLRLTGMTWATYPSHINHCHLELGMRHPKPQD